MGKARRQATPAASDGSANNGNGGTPHCRTVKLSAGAGQHVQINRIRRHASSRVVYDTPQPGRQLSLERASAALTEREVKYHQHIRYFRIVIYTLRRLTRTSVKNYNGCVRDDTFKPGGSSECVPATLTLLKAERSQSRRQAAKSPTDRTRRHLLRGPSRPTANEYLQPRRRPNIDPLPGSYSSGQSRRIQGSVPREANCS